ncbi:MAG: peroxidase [Gemmatimonadetes bacterium]|nr:peroxidase [Candidatus Palauibacter australiensis]
MARAIRIDYRTAALDAKTRRLMDYAVAITREPTSTARRDIDGLREVGWTDAQILTATEIVGFFNYYVRMVEALGVEPEPEMERDPAVWPDP